MVHFCAESRRLSKAASEFPGLFGVEEWEEEEVALATYTSAILSLFDAGGGTQETFLSLVDKVGAILGASSVLNSVSEVFE